MNDTALADAVDFYDTMCAELSERCARVAAVYYMRRKLPALDPIRAAELLANELARRASLNLVTIGVC